jgi:hypothetical protein
MSLTIGRATIDDPDTVRHSGDRLSLQGNLVPTSVDEMKAIRQQLLGLVDNRDEEVWPLIWSEDSSHDGFYEVAGVDLDPYLTHLSTGGPVRYSIELERINNYALPRFQTTTLATVRPNGHGITTADCNAGSYVKTSINDNDYATSGVSSLVTRGASASNPQIVVHSAAAPFTGARVSWNARADEHYSLQCVIEQSRSGTYYPVVGRDVDWSGGNWRISNGLIRVSPWVSDANYLDVEIYDWTASQWESSVFRHGYDNGAGTFVETAFVGTRPDSTGNIATPFIIRNGPQRVTLGFDCISSARRTLTLTAGDHHVVYRLESAGSRKWGGKFDAAYTPSAMGTATVGIRDGSNDGNGNRKVLMGASAMTNDTVNAETYLTTAATSVTLGLGIVLNGNSAAAGNQSADLQAQFLGATRPHRRVVAR